MHHLGKRDARPPTADHVPMRELLKAVPSMSLPPIPANFGHGYDFGQAGWGMLGNGPCDDGTVPSDWAAYQGAGDCVFAAAAHSTMENVRNAQGFVPRFTCLNVLQEYGDYAGYDLRTGANDNGSDMQEVLTRRQTRGLLDAGGVAHKIGKTVSLAAGDVHELWAAAYLFEQAEIGVRLQQAQEDAFPGPWRYTRASPEIGGHAIVIPGNNGLLSWAQRVPWTQDFVTHQMDEGYSFIDMARYNSVTGETLEHFNDADLEKFVVLVAAAKRQAG